MRIIGCDKLRLCALPIDGMDLPERPDSAIPGAFTAGGGFGDEGLELGLGEGVVGLEADVAVDLEPRAAVDGDWGRARFAEEFITGLSLRNRFAEDEAGGGATGVTGRRASPRAPEFLELSTS